MPSLSRSSLAEVPCEEGLARCSVYCRIVEKRIISLNRALAARICTQAIDGLSGPAARIESFIPKLTMSTFRQKSDCIRHVEEPLG
jgi:hypothetical protein